MNPGSVIRGDIAGPPALEPDRTNVVPFARRGEASARSAPEILVTPADRALEEVARRRVQMVALIVCSAAIHAALYLPFTSEPEPMASLGEMVISAEIVIGTNTPAGPVDESGQAQASAPEPARAPEPAPDPPAAAFAQSEPPKPETTPTAPPPDMQLPPPSAPAHVTALPEPQPSAEPPPVLRDEPLVAPSPPVEQVEQPKTKVTPEPPPRPPPPKQRANPLPKKPEKPKANSRRASLVGTPNESRSTAPPATSAAGTGRGRSDADSNYAGVVAAHLARYKQFPADARSRGDQGRASVTFSLSGSGGVTAVRLTRGTGVASLDAEATAMVRRASPFPPPPHGRPVSFTFPVSFRLN